MSPRPASRYTVRQLRPRRTVRQSDRGRCDAVPGRRQLPCSPGRPGRKDVPAPCESNLQRNPGPRLNLDIVTSSGTDASSAYLSQPIAGLTSRPTCRAAAWEPAPFQRRSSAVPWHHPAPPFRAADNALPSAYRVSARNHRRLGPRA
jgi:hypothetical protein